MPNQFGDIPDRGVTTAAQRRLGVEPGLTLSLSPELTISLTYPNEELLYHLGWKRYAVSAPIAAVAAQGGRVQLRVPDTANVICVLERLELSESAAFEMRGSFGLGPGNVDLGTIFGSAMVLDGRNRQTRSTSVVSFDTAVPALTGTGGLEAVVLGNTQYAVPNVPLVMVPGNAFLVATVQVNAILNFTMVYRERILNDQENSS